jgi:acyl-CoA synthetase (AMP-forming)/AMP-acid ligase II
MKDLLQRAVEMTKRPIKIVYIKLGNEVIPEGGINFHELIDRKGVDLSSLETRDRDPNEVAILPYSSGTTGMSKGVMLSHRNVVSSSMMMNSDTGNGSVTYPAEGDYQDVLANVLPFFHIYGLTCTLLSKLAHGCKLITLPQFKPDTYLHVLETYKCTVLYLVPPSGECFGKGPYFNYVTGYHPGGV